MRKNEMELRFELNKIEFLRNEIGSFSKLNKEDLLTILKQFGFNEEGKFTKKQLAKKVDEIKAYSLIRMFEIYVELGNKERALDTGRIVNLFYKEQYENYVDKKLLSIGVDINEKKEESPIVANTNIDFDDDDLPF